MAFIIAAIVIIALALVPFGAVIALGLHLGLGWWTVAPALSYGGLYFRAS